MPRGRKHFAAAAGHHQHQLKLCIHLYEAAQSCHLDICSIQSDTSMYHLLEDLQEGFMDAFSWNPTLVLPNIWSDLQSIQDQRDK